MKKDCKCTGCKCGKGMDFYVIPPNDHLELMDRGDRYFCLSQIYLRNEEYRNFFKARVAEGKWVTLDNGAGDHETVTKEQVLEIAIDLQPSELIPLDILFDGKSTLDNLKWTIEAKAGIPSLSNVEIFACPQGKDLDEWLEVYQYMIDSPDVDTIGMSKLAIPWVMSGVKFGDVGIAQDRNDMYKLLTAQGLIQKPLHFLGAGEPWEFELYRGDPLVRSTDSCFTVWGGMNNQRFGTEDYERIPTPHDYFEREITDEQMKNVIHNIEYMKKVTK